MNYEMLRVSLPVRENARKIVGCDTRELFFVAARDHDRIGFGECAPLPGLHAETLEECMESIEHWSNGLRDLDSLAPCAAFALSCALETLNGFGAHPVAPAKVAALYPGTFEQCDQTTLDSLAEEVGECVVADQGADPGEVQGAGVVKIKWGRDSEFNDRALLARMCKALPTTRFRIDGNRLLTLEECVKRLESIDASRVEYLEEPLKDPSQLAVLAQSTGIAIALDETVLDRSAHAREIRDSLSRTGCVSAWVLRMSSIGSLDTIRALVAQAAHYGADAVLSTSYESSYSLRIAVHFAAQIPNAKRHHGIGTAALLEQDSCQPAFVRKGFIDGCPLPTPLAEAWV